MQGGTSRGPCLQGVCRTPDNFVVFVPRAIPGETVKVEIRKVDAREYFPVLPSSDLAARFGRAGLQLAGTHQAEGECKPLPAGSAEACKLETVSASPHAVEPPCQHFDVCGGCSHQHISYAAQLEQKHNWVRWAGHRSEVASLLLAQAWLTVACLHAGSGGSAAHWQDRKR